MDGCRLRVPPRLPPLQLLPQPQLLQLALQPAPEAAAAALSSDAALEPCKRRSSICCLQGRAHAAPPTGQSTSCLPCTLHYALHGPPAGRLLPKSGWLRHDSSCWFPLPPAPTSTGLAAAPSHLSQWLLTACTAGNQPWRCTATMLLRRLHAPSCTCTLHPRPARPRPSPHLQALVQHAPLPLDAHVLGPLHEAAHVALGRQVAANACSAAPGVAMQVSSRPSRHVQRRQRPAAAAAARSSHTKIGGHCECHVAG